MDCVIIPARGGSKRIPRKNLAKFLGISMLERSIHTAKLVSDCVIVSSEDNEILESARQLGVYTLKREKEFADDFTPTLPVIASVVYKILSDGARKQFHDYMQQDIYMNNLALTQSNVETIKHTLQYIQFAPQTSNEAQNLAVFDLHSTILCLYATSMFATQDSLLQALHCIHTQQSAYVVSIIQNAKNFRSFTHNEEGYFQFIFPQYMHTRSQDLPEAFNDAGQFYLGFAKSFLFHIPILGKQSLGVELEYAWDIDSPQDLAIAETLFSLQHKGN
ncbi:hypothetical protein CQA53_03880 [Helicobacter didelphidarum]|uniref:Pseudaminic acid cytidylyltransferase n=1 Tax=Helicobacter didelphidarum TaxID=2040648 RepID=A0A3D8IN99_9HELI|nr:hypothetical protein CQA53_03880 [Helicobacter didelphidarum]